MSPVAVSNLPVTPSRDEARALARDYNVIPLRHTFIDDIETPVSAFLKLRGRGPAFLLESAEQGQRFGRYSFLGFRPRAVLRYEHGTITAEEGGERRDLGGTDPFGAVTDFLSSYRVAPLEGLPPFAGGAVGMFGYDLVRTVERLPEPNPDDIGTPDMALMVSDALVVFDHLSHSVTILVNAFVESAEEVDAAYDGAVGLIERARDLLAQPVPRREATAARPVDPRAAFESNMTRPEFEAAVTKAKEYIFAGDAFQVVPSHRWTGPCPVQPFSIYRGLRVVNPSPYMYFLEFDDFAIAGASPEPMLKVGGGHAEVRPIAGTRPRASTPEEDLELARGLLEDEKERAEHMMLVDLGRNDLGRVCEYGTVEGGRPDARRDLLARDAHRLLGVRQAARRDERDGRAARLPARRHAVRRAEDPRDGDHRRARAGQARLLRWRDRLPQLLRRPRHLHPHPHGRREGRACLHPGGRREWWPTPIRPTSTVRRSRRRARCSRRMELACGQGEWE